MTHKERIILYPDSVRRLITDMIPGFVSRNYDAVILPSGYDLRTPRRRQDPALRLRVVGAGIDDLTPDMVLMLTREACFAACNEWSIKPAAITIEGDPRGIDVTTLRGELGLMHETHRKGYTNLQLATLEEGSSVWRR